MKLPVLETLSGSVNGINMLFQTSVPYRKGAIQVFLNGLAVPGEWTALGGRRILFKVPVKPGDIVQAFYIPG